MILSRRSFLQAGGKFGLAGFLAGAIGRGAYGQEKSLQMLGTGIGNPVPKEILGDPSTTSPARCSQKPSRASSPFALERWH